MVQNSLLGSVIYGATRFGLWSGLLAVGILDGKRHSEIRSKGWQLYLLLIVVTALFVIRNGFYLGLCINGVENDTVVGRVLYVMYILWSDTAMSVWIFSLLAISAGFCITRTDLGQHKGVCYTIPTVFFVTSLTIDVILFLNSGMRAFKMQKPYEPQTEDIPDDAEDPIVTLDVQSGMIFVFATLANTMVFFMSWFYMYDTAREEWLCLKERIEGGGSLHAPEAQEQTLADPAMLDEEVYTSVRDIEDNPIKTVEECISDREKLTLMHRFFAAVCVYNTAEIVMFFVPLFVPNILEATLLIVYDAFLLVFVASLLFVFRLRESNQFIQVAGEELDVDDTMAPTTELGEVELQHTVGSRYGSHDESRGMNPNTGGSSRVINAKQH